MEEGYSEKYLSHKEREELYKLYDSRILLDKQQGDTRWGKSAYDSSIESFNNYFRLTLPEAYRIGGLRDYIERIFADRKGKARAIEFGGPMSELSKGFSEGFFGNTLGVTLVDRRSSEKIEEDNQRHHKLIEGNFFDPSVLQQIKEWTKGEGVEVIFERLLEGNELVPPEPYLLAETINNDYKLLSPEGVMFLELGDKDHLGWKKLTKATKEWTAFLQNEYAKVLEVSTLYEDVSAMRLRKKPGAPENLPFLTPRQLKKIYNNGK
jgi:hypothetical protein